ncbi:hypothetical protein VD659_15100 [Herbiconiux sp. 11R-BC]|uniref:hypothetical protein n=1 Tax=Herbiconiux sp. 11R-BC TaxID=3111637 RepID=UPI003C08FB46
MKEATFTSFLRTPRVVAALAEQGGVLITRRDAADLVLLRASDLENRQAGIALVAQLVRAVLRSRDMAAALRELFAWTSLLNDGELTACACELEKQFWAAAELGEYDALLVVVAGWRSTARSRASGVSLGV